MPRPKKPPRLFLRRDRDGERRWVIRTDGGRQIRTGCLESEAERAAGKLADYIGTRRRPDTSRSNPAQILIADILTVYLEEVSDRTARPKETEAAIGRLNAWWGDKTVSEILGPQCRAFAEHRGTSSGARRDLETLRAATNHYAREYGLDAIPRFTLPRKSQPRERWLTRSEAAALIRSARKHKRRRHLVRFMLIALYTGTRHKAILDLQWMPNTQGGWIDLDAGVIYRRGQGEAETAKRRPPVKIPRSLLPHLKRWRRMNAGERYVVSYNGRRCKRISKALRETRADVGLGADVVAHTFRHTAGTWLAQRGVKAREAADYLGVSEEEFERTYYHHDPKYQQEAANAL